MMGPTSTVKTRSTSDGDDTPHGWTGNDTLRAADGDDVLFGDDGNDKLYGGAGHDHVLGRPGEKGRVGVDVEWIEGGYGNDVLTGNSADNRISGWLGNDVIHGGAGNDELDGHSSRDKVHGDSGDDILYGEDDSVDADRLDGGSNGSRGDDCDPRRADIAVHCER
jgi:serralysin